MVARFVNFYSMFYRGYRKYCLVNTSEMYSFGCHNCTISAFLDRVRAAMNMTNGNIIAAILAVNRHW